MIRNSKLEKNAKDLYQHPDEKAEEKSDLNKINLKRTDDNKLSKLIMEICFSISLN